ncbi:tyrosine serine protein [Favolaschia claudopus]|uniref:Tyrosine serine protein n=1 Tax=Favolaschia claudopus TaxID=2862362 RepID=A0AAW0DTF8_9AGAR
MAESPFTGIYNFRDVGSVVNSLSGKKNIKEKTLYRSGRLDDATSTDRKKLVSEYSLQTVIDLRTKSEHIKQTQTHQKQQFRGSHHEQPPWDVIYINFAGRNFEMNMLKQLRWWQLLWFMILMLFQFRMHAIRILGRNVLGPKGLLGLSKDSLLFCQREILQSLEIYTSFKSYPLLIHCTQGKDRAGLIIMLLLFICKIPLEHIKADYALSNEGLAPVRASMIKEVEEIGMAADYTLAPPQVVDTVYDFLQTEYGGVEAYLNLIGFGKEKRQTVRRLLLVDPDIDADV